MYDVPKMTIYAVFKCDNTKQRRIFLTYMMPQPVLLPICYVGKDSHSEFAMNNLPTESIISAIFAKVSENIVWF